MEEHKYNEIGTNYRYFLSWRHAAFVGELIVLYGVISLTVSMYKDDMQKFAWIVPLLSSPIGFLLYVIDKRTRLLYHAAIRAGKALEGEGGGFFTELDKDVIPTGTPILKDFSHSLALDILFNGSSVLLLVVSAVLFILARN